MLDKQTAIELAEGLGLKLVTARDLCKEDTTISGVEYINKGEGVYIRLDDYFTFERMALLALEYEIDVINYSKSIEVEMVYFRDGKWEPYEVDHNGSLEDKQRAYCMAVAKVLIEIKRNGE